MAIYHYSKKFVSRSKGQSATAKAAYQAPEAWLDRSALWNAAEKAERDCNAILDGRAHIDHRSLKAQGLDREPTIHLGPAAAEKEKRGEEAAAAIARRDARTGPLAQIEAISRLERKAEGPANGGGEARVPGAARDRRFLQG